MGYINTTQSKTAFDASDVSLLGKVNLMNLFAGYKGVPRLFEVEAVAGAGWLHYYVKDVYKRQTSYFLLFPEYMISSFSRTNLFPRVLVKL